MGVHISMPPIHFAANTWTADEVPLSSLILPAVVVDVTDEAASNRDYLLTADSLKQWEAQYGRIPKGSAVLMNTGFAKFWPDQEQYMGTPKRGPEGNSRAAFPRVSPNRLRVS